MDAQTVIATHSATQRVRAVEIEHRRKNRERGAADSRPTTRCLPRASHRIALPRTATTQVVRARSLTPIAVR